MHCFFCAFAHSALLQLGVLPRTDSDDQQNGIFWIDVLEGSSMCNVAGLTMASFDIRVVLIISIPIGVILIVAAIFVIRWCYRKKQKNATVDVELLVQSQHFKKYGTKNPNDVNLVDQ